MARRLQQAFAYLRASHRTSVESGAGLAAQNRDVEDMLAMAAVPGLTWAKERHDHDQPGRFCDKGVSAFSRPFFSRPAAIALMKAMRSGDHLFVSKTDRIFRSVRNMGLTLCELKRLKITLHLGDIPMGIDTPAGNFYLSILTTMAEWESQMRSFRNKEAAAIRKARLAGECVVGIEDLRQNPADLEKHTYGFSSKARGQSDPRILATIPPRRVERKRTELLPGRIFLYIRCSHVDSAESGLGLQWQEQACRLFAERLQRQNPKLAEVILCSDEAISAYMHRLKLRPNGKKMCELLQPGDHVVFARLDRAFRSLRDCCETLPEWDAKGVSAHFASDNIDTTTPQGQALLHIMAVFAQLEPQLISTRTREALAELRVQGRGVNPCFGFKWAACAAGRMLVPDKVCIAKIRLSVFLTRLGFSRRGAAKRIEELCAKRENRKPLPAAGVFLKKAREYIGDRNPQQYTAKRGKKLKYGIPLLIPEWDYRDVVISSIRWPMIQAYLAQKQLESKAVRGRLLSCSETTSCPSASSLDQHVSTTPASRFPLAVRP